MSRIDFCEISVEGETEKCYYDWLEKQMSCGWFSTSALATAPSSTEDSSLLQSPNAFGEKFDRDASRCVRSAINTRDKRESHGIYIHQISQSESDGYYLLFVYMNKYPNMNI